MSKLSLGALILATASRVPTTRAHSYIEKLLPFRTNGSMRAETTRTPYIGVGPDGSPRLGWKIRYEVYSYSTIIGFVEAVIGHDLSVYAIIKHTNPNKYSRTTSKHQSAMRRGFAELPTP